MTDGFEAFLAAELAPPDSLPDRHFVAGVQARIAMEKRLRQQRQALLASLATQLIALSAVAAAIWSLSSAAPIANWISEFPGTARVILLAAFALTVALFSWQPAQADVAL